MCNAYSILILNNYHIKWLFTSFSYECTWPKKKWKSQVIFIETVSCKLHNLSSQQLVGETYDAAGVCSVLCAIQHTYHSCCYSKDGDEEKWHQHGPDGHIPIQVRGLSSTVHCIYSGWGRRGGWLHKQKNPSLVLTPCSGSLLKQPLCCSGLILVVHVTSTWYNCPS